MNVNRLLRLAPLLSVLCLARPVHAEDTVVTDSSAIAAPSTFSGSTTAVLEWRNDNRNGDRTDDNYGDMLVRTNLLQDGGDTRMTLRIDGAGFVSRPVDVDRRNYLRMERVTLEMSRTLGRVRTQLTLGDFYAQFGSGLALSLRRVDELGLDMATRGGRLDAFFGDDRLQVTVLGGLTNSANIEATRLRFTEDPEDTLGGARIEGRFGLGTVGLHGATVRQADVPDGQPHPINTNVGADTNLSMGDFTLQLEVDGQRRDLGSAINDGHAAYANLTGQLGRTTLVFEGKHYSRFEPLFGSWPGYQENRFFYSFSPTAERIDQEVLDNTDTTGGRARADVVTNADTASSVHANVAVFRNRNTDLWFGHAYGGVDRRFASGGALLVSGGYRREWHPSDSAVSPGQLFRAIAHGELDWLTPIAQGLSIHLIAMHRSLVEQVGSRKSISHRGNSSLEFDVGERWIFLGGVDWNTQDTRDGIRTLFGFVTVRYRPSDRFFIQALAGSQRGGIRCVAGACRDFPPFSGVRLDTTVRF